MIKKNLLLALSLLTFWSLSAQTYFSEQNTIFQLEEYSACQIFTCDIDGDGDTDVLSATASNDTIAWYENTDGEGTFGALKIICDTAYDVCSVSACDIDCDGDQDVLSSSSNGIAWYENTDGEGTFGSQQIISGSACLVYACDLDGDGDPDILKAKAYDISWHENIDSAGTFGEEQFIDQSVYIAASIFPCEIDGDEGQDFLLATAGLKITGFDDYFTWYKNTDGTGTFDQQPNISTYTTNSICSIYASDIDGDGDQDVLAASVSYYYGNGLATGDYAIAWYENTDGNGTFGAKQVITSAFKPHYPFGQVSICTYDIDGDGDQDVLAATSLDDKIAWYLNTDGHGTFNGEQVILVDSTGFPRSAQACDIDGDGDPDVVTVSSFSATNIGWYENITLEILTQPMGMTSCPGSGALFSLVAEGVETYQWQVDEGTGFTDLSDDIVYSGVTTPDLSISNADTSMNGYIFRCVLDPAGTIHSDEAVLTVEDKTAASLSCTVNQTVQADETQYYTVSGAEFDPTETSDNCGIASMENDFTNTATLAGAQIPEGTTTITWTITDNAGNENTCSFDLSVMAYSAVVDMLQHKGISVYPNPTTGIVNFEFAGKPVQRLSLFDISGNQLAEKTHLQQNESMDLSGFERGVYIICIYTDEEIHILKMMKE